MEGEKSKRCLLILLLFFSVEDDVDGGETGENDISSETKAQPSGTKTTEQTVKSEEPFPSTTSTAPPQPPASPETLANKTGESPSP